MPAIRNKTLQSRRMGTALHGVGNLEEGLSAYDPYSSQAATQSPNYVTKILDFGTSLLNYKAQSSQQPQTQVRYVQAPQSSMMGGMSTPLLIAAGLAAVFILTMKK